MVSELAKRIEKALATVLLPCGFTKRGFLFLRQSHDVFHLVELQNSVANTRTNSKCTVNVGVWVPALASDDKPSLAAAHWRQRLGLLCPEHEDMWWQTSSQQSASALAAEVADRVQRYALPSFVSLANASALVAVWRGGTSPGLTKVQASRFERLLAASRQ